MIETTRTGRSVMLWMLRLALCGIFLYAGTAKMREAQAFAESIASFRMLPEPLISPVALALPPTEVLAGVLTLTGGLLRRAGAFCQLSMLAVFTLALATALARGLHVDCGCFGPDRFDVLSPTKNLWVALGRDMGLTAIAWILYTDARRPASVRGIL